MNQIACITANYVARQLDYHMTRGWGQGERATMDYFRPPESFEARFDALLAEVRALDFDAVDLWVAHLHPSWATPEQVETARALLARHGLRVTSLAGGFGGTPAEFEATCRLASALGAPVLAGNTALLERERGVVVEMLGRYGLRLGVENHPERSPAELLAKIGDGAGGTIGAALDTGWFGTQGYDAAQAIRELRDHLLIVHLKDVREAGAHNTCAYGQGVVPIHACVRALREIGYGGTVSVEHEPEDRDPTEEIRASRALLLEWLAE